ncbi:MAG: hypothetical protein KA885_08870 [Spirochaetes bacterium]|nr:hypothetical protein [Spirochaetota bacterium]
MELSIINENSIDIEKKNQIDQFINDAITENKKNSNAIVKMSMKCISGLASNKARLNELHNQGFFKKMWNTITGKNKDIRYMADMDLNGSLYACQQTIKMISKQNLITLEVVAAMYNELVRMGSETNIEINTIYSYLNSMTSMIADNSSKIRDIERETMIIKWKSSIKHKVFGDRKYKDLLETAQLICLTNDFYRLSGGKWYDSDILLLEALILDDFKWSEEKSISIEEIFLSAIDNRELIDKYFDGISIESLSDIDPFYIPIAKGFEKINRLYNEERYLIDTIKEELEKKSVKSDEKDLIFSLTDKYIKEKVFIDIKKSVPINNFFLEMLLNLRIVDEKNIKEIENRGDDDKIDKLEEKIEDIDEKVLVNGQNNQEQSSDEAVSEEELERLFADNEDFVIDKDMKIDIGECKEFKNKNIYIRANIDLSGELIFINCKVYFDNDLKENNSSRKQSYSNEIQIENYIDSKSARIRFMCCRVEILKNITIFKSIYNNNKEYGYALKIDSSFLEFNRSILINSTCFVEILANSKCLIQSSLIKDNYGNLVKWSTFESNSSLILKGAKLINYVIRDTDFTVNRSSSITPFGKYFGL